MQSTLLANYAYLFGPRVLKSYRTAANFLSIVNSRGRQLSSFTPTPSSSTSLLAHLNEATFHDIADRTLDELSEIAGHLEHHLDDVDVSLSQGVLTLTLGQPHNKNWVINKQTPNRQIWWSSPLSGPRRYDWWGRAVSPHDKAIIYGKLWKFSRDGSQDLHSCLVSELELVTGVDLAE